MLNIEDNIQKRTENGREITLVLFVVMLGNNMLGDLSESLSGQTLKL
jgi:hypothetical protein